jgi:hypothetical protein
MSLRTGAEVSMLLLIRSENSIILYQIDGRMLPKTHPAASNRRSLHHLRWPQQLMVEDPKLNGDPRSLIMMQGILPDTSAVDTATALGTTDKASEIWTNDKIRG